MSDERPIRKRSEVKRPHHVVARARAADEEARAFKREALRLRISRGMMKWLDARGTKLGGGDRSETVRAILLEAMLADVEREAKRATAGSG